jgi:hypothetical protein
MNDPFVEIATAAMEWSEWLDRLIDEYRETHDPALRRVIYEQLVIVEQMVEEWEAE